MNKTRLLSRIKVTALVGLVGLGISPPVDASDHLDAINTLLDESADLTGLMTFTSPERPGHLVMIMDVHPIAKSRSKFSDKVSYNFRLREVKRVGEKGKFDVVLEPEPEHRVSCHLAEGSEQMTCKAGPEHSVTVAIDDTSGGGSEDMRVFAGLRSDPFFMDIPGYLETYILQRAVDVMPPEARAYFDGAPPDETTPRVFRFTGKNSVEGGNVLSIVVELDVAKVFGPEAGPVFAVAIETMERGHR